jgi:hypothetical protein
MTAFDSFSGETPDGAFVTVTFVEDDGAALGDDLAVPGWLAVTIGEGRNDPDPVEFSVNDDVARVLIQGLAVVIR